MQLPNELTEGMKKSLSESLSESWGKLQKGLDGDPTILVDLAWTWLQPAVQALGIMIACFFIAKYASRVLSLPLNRKVDETLGRFVEKLVYRGVIGAGFIIVLQNFGIQSTSFAAALAAAGFAIALAFQGTLSNFASGILLMVFRPFKVGDLVVAGGITARVHEIDLFTTVVDTPDNRRLIIPNSAVSSATIENVTFHAVRRIDMPISIAHHADVDATRAAFWAAIDSINDVIIQTEERKSAVLMTGITTVCVEWTVRVWGPSKEFQNIRDVALVSIKKHLQQHAIPLAIPQMGVTVNQSSTQHSGAENFKRVNVAEVKANSSQANTLGAVTEVNLDCPPMMQQAASQIAVETYLKDAELQIALEQPTLKKSRMQPRRAA